MQGKVQGCGRGGDGQVCVSTVVGQRKHLEIPSCEPHSSEGEMECPLWPCLPPPGWLPPASPQPRSPEPTGSPHAAKASSAPVVGGVGLALSGWGALPIPLQFSSLHPWVHLCFSLSIPGLFSLEGSLCVFQRDRAPVGPSPSSSLTSCIILDYSLPSLGLFVK